MKVLAWIGGAILLTVLVLAIWSGLTVGQGGVTADAFWQALGELRTWGQQRTQGLRGLQTAGNPWAAIGAAAAAMLLTLALFPGTRSGRGFATLAIVFTALAFVLYDPSTLTSAGSS